MVHHISRCATAIFKEIFVRQYSIQCRRKGNSSLVYGWNVHRQYHDKNKPKNEICSDYEDVVLTNDTVPEFIWKDLDKWEDKTAVVCGITGRGYTYFQAHRMSIAFAACLRNKLGIRDGDCVAVILPNCPEYPLAVIGGLQAGAIITTMNPVYTEEEIFHQLKDSGMKVIVTNAAIFPKVQGVLKSLKKSLPVIVADCDTTGAVPNGAIKFSEFAENFSECTDCLKEVRRTAQDVALLPYSSGTTGLPKGVELTHKNVTSNCSQYGSRKFPYFRPTTKTVQDATLCVLPFFHIYGLILTMFKRLRFGMKIVTLPKFTPQTYVNALEKSKPAVLYLVPPLVHFLTQSKDVGEKQLESVTSIICGAAPLAESDILRFLDKAKSRFSFMQGYGLTETASLLMCQERGTGNFKSVGGLLANTTAMIMDLKEQKPLGPHQVGEIWVKGPQVMKGYFNNKKATDETLMPGGWLRTGDLAYYDDNHYFYIQDRLKELIKVRGYQVPPAELEGILMTHPDLQDAAVIGKSHAKYGEVPKAFVVRKSNSSPSGEDIMRFVAEKVTSYKKLEEVQFVDSIPKTASGKILRRQLKQLYT